MAAFKNFLSQNRRYYTSDPNLNRHLSYLFRRKFSSSETTDPNPEQSPSPNSRKQPLPIQPVSYPTKPKSEQQQQTSNVQQASLLDELDSATSDSRRSWTRDEMRYMKDSSSSSVSPVSYQARVAPLPEDRVGEEGRRNEELERERRRIDNDDDDDKWRAMRERGVLRYGKRGEEEEDANLPLPRMIKAAGENGGGDQESKKKKKSKVVYDLKEAIRLVKAGARVTFDETLEAHVRMTPDLRRTDLKLSGFVRFPHGFGKTYRVAVFAEGAAADEARDAGADVVGGPELVENIQTGQLKIDFDKCISTPSMMEHVKKLSRNLKQLMPDPKKGTVTNDMSKTVKEAKEKGVLFKKDKTAIVHVGLGKVSFAEDALRDNIGAFVNALLLAKPAGLKKSSKYAGYVDSFHICSTMGSSFPITIQSLSMAADRYNRLQLRGQPESI